MFSDIATLVVVGLAALGGQLIQVWRSKVEAREQRQLEKERDQRERAAKARDDAWQRHREQMEQLRTTVLDLVRAMDERDQAIRDASSASLSPEQHDRLEGAIQQASQRVQRNVDLLRLITPAFTNLYEAVKRDADHVRRDEVVEGVRSLMLEEDPP